MRMVELMCTIYTFKGGYQMKKLLIFMLVLSLMLSVLVIGASAEGISRMDCGIDIELKKTDPALVIKNGVIDPGEYEKYEWTGDLEIGESNLTMQWGAGGHVYWTEMVEMGNSSEWYFSWDEVHGFNFAVVITIPEAGFHTNWPQNERDSNGHVVDSFMGNVGLNIWNSTELFNQQFPGALYYSIGRDIDSGAYLKGHIGTLGNTGIFDPIGGVDYVIEYVGNTATFEWSIPFSDFIISDAGYNVVVTEGLEFPFSITVTAGDSTPEGTGNYHDKSYGIQFGQNAWFLDQANRERDSAWFTVSYEYVEGAKPEDTSVSSDTAASAPADTDAPTTPPPTIPVTTEVVTEIVTEVVTSQIAVTDEAGNEVTDEAGAVVTEVVSEIVSEVVTSIVTNEVTTAGAANAPATGDAAVIASVMAVVAACGAVVAKKKR